ncbi:MAG: hypothetical protein GKS06_06340 [Acidobacteria bacterium]|nr:hypothetical protein [Acidobacteriota bacterium]
MPPASNWSPRGLYTFGLLAAISVSATIGAQERAYRGRDGSLLELTDDQVLAVLQDGEILADQALGSGTTGVRRLELNLDGVVLRAVFRHVDRYETDLRMRDGTNYAGFYDRYSAECAAYELGVMLGLDMIPPAALRRVSGDPGSVQLWVEDAMTEGDRGERGLEPPDTALWSRQQAILRGFDALIANHDRNTGNSLIDPDWNLWLIDHSRAFQVPRGRVSYDRVNQLPREFWNAIVNLDVDEARNRLGDYLDRSQIRALFGRHQELIAHVENLIAQRGTEAVLID